jgi:tetratricopeptide (TPR) repeat protein
VERFDALSLDTTRPRNAPALRAYVRHLIASGDPESAHEAISAALEAHPDAAAFHSIAGLEQDLLEKRIGAGREEYERALELDPNERFALEAMGRFALSEGDLPSAIEYLDRTAQAAPEDAALQIRVARLLTETDRTEPDGQDSSEPDAIRPQITDRWQGIAREFPWEPEPLEELSKLALGRSDTQTALELARRAVRLGGGREAWELVAEIHEARGESDLARKARTRSRGTEDPAAS